MVGVVTVGFCGVCGVLLLLLLLLIILMKVRTGFNEIDEKYGKPYKANIVKMIGGHPKLKRGSMAISFHPNDAIAFNRKVFLFSQISSIKIISELPNKFKNANKSTVNLGLEEKYICIAATDKYGEHEVVFTTESGFEEISNELIRKWNKYNLLS